LRAFLALPENRINTVRFGISVRSVEKTDYPSYVQVLCGIAFILSGKLQKKHCLFEKDVL